MDQEIIASSIQDNLASTLSALVDSEVKCVLAPSEADGPPGQDGVLLVGATESGPALTLVLENAWTEYLSAALASAGDQDPSRLTVAVSTRIYGEMRKALTALGVASPSLTISPGESMEAVPLQEWPERSSWDFSVEVSGATLSGWICFDALQFPHQLAKDEDVNQQAVDNVPLPDLGAERVTPGDAATNLALLAGVEVEVTVELGRRRLALNDLLHLTRGSVIELEKLVGEPLEVYANGRLIADGEAVVIDEQFGIRITNLVAQPVQQRNAA